MNYFIFNEVDSREFNGLVVNELKTIVRHSEKVERYNIPLYNGQMINETGFYDTAIRTVECTLKDFSELDKILKWLRGSGHVIFSNQEDRYYMATIVNEISFDRVLKHVRKFVIQFECQPFGYLNEGKENITYSESGVYISNIGTVESEPIVTVYGYGEIELTIGDTTFSITDVSEKVTVDVPLLEVYNDTVLMNRNYIGDFPMLRVGDNIIQWKGDVERVDIIPNWRCM